MPILFDELFDVINDDTFLTLQKTQAYIMTAQCDEIPQFWIILPVVYATESHV